MNPTEMVNPIQLTSSHPNYCKREALLIENWILNLVPYSKSDAPYF